VACLLCDFVFDTTRLHGNLHLFTDLQELSEEKHKQAVQNDYNFDSPDAFDIECIVYTLRRLKEGKSVEIPIYNFTTHRVEKKKVIFTLLLFFIVSERTFNRSCHGSMVRSLDSPALATWMPDLILPVPEISVIRL